MNYTDCIHIHEVGCKHFVNRLECPKECPGYAKRDEVKTEPVAAPEKVKK